MPIGPGGAAAITGGAGLLGTVINSISQSEQNRKDRKFTKEMYYEQRKHSLEDWAMQNEYNHPSSQMSRLREAGLNPNLVYGNGADVTAQPNRGVEAKQYQQIAPKIDLGSVASSSLGAYLDASVKQAQVDNLRVQNTVLEQEKWLKLAQTVGTLASANKTGVDTKRSQFDLDLESESRNITLQARQAAVNKQLAETQYTLDENKRKEALQSPMLEKLATEILANRKGVEKTDAEIKKIAQEISNLQNANRLQDLEILLKKNGLSWSDPVWARMLVMAVGGNPSLPNPLAPKSFDGGSRPIIKGATKAGKYKK